MTFNVIASRVYISIHALLAESDSSKTHDRHKTTISIHALLAESDRNFINSNCNSIQFLSTLSLRRATVTVLGIQHKVGISIHALLAESDPRKIRPVAPDISSISIHALLAESDYGTVSRLHSNSVYFYPRSPCGERLISGSRYRRTSYFYPRSPCGERHRYGRPIDVQFVISIHALLAESDKLSIPVPA